MEKQFNDVGIGTAEFNVNDQRMSHELGILTAPALCVISQKRVYHFQNPEQLTETNIKEFVRKSIPIQRYIPTVGGKNEFLWGKETRFCWILVTNLGRNSILDFFV